MQNYSHGDIKNMLQIVNKIQNTSNEFNLTKPQINQIVSEAFVCGAFSSNDHQDSSNFWKNIDDDKQTFINEDLVEILKNLIE